MRIPSPAQNIIARSSNGRTVPFEGINDGSNPSLAADMKKVLQKLGLKPNNSIVIGSGILQALGIRKSKDIDIIVTQEIYDSLKKTGKFDVLQNHDRESLKGGFFEIGTD